jgi:hypothetical protein
MLKFELINADLLLVLRNFDFMGSCDVDEFIFEVLSEITLLGELEGKALVSFLYLRISNVLEFL